MCESVRDAALADRKLFGTAFEWFREGWFPL